MFSDHTSQVWKLPEELFSEKTIEIEWEFQHEGEIMHLAQIRQLFSFKDCYLYMSYLPYARQDKPINNLETFALLPFATIINHMNFKEVKVLDSHSIISEYVFNNCINIKPIAYINKTLEIIKPDVICFPDEGAKDRYFWITFPNKVFAEKTRNQLTGELTGCILHGDVKDKSVLIVDDICDGGGTFINLANALQIASDVNLYVTHGIFSKGVKVLKDANIKRIFTKNGEATNSRGYFDEIIYKPYGEIT